MADAQLSVELVAKIDGLRDSFNKAIRETDNLDKVTKSRLLSIDKGFAQLANSIDNSVGSKLANTVKNTSNSVSRDLAKMAKASAVTGGGIAKGGKEAGQALTDLGRIASDAPFGFVAIQNNIDPLIQSFGRLKTETGSTGGALKALAGSLIGPAGFGIAISAISAAIILYQQYQQRANKTVKEAKEGTDDYVNSLSQLDQVQVKGAQNALKERTELATLYGITQNVTISTKQRLDAVNELQNKYPEYFKNLKDETILNGGAKDAYDRLTTSIIATAKARAAGALIEKNSARGLENDQKRLDAEIAYGKAVQRQNAALQKQRQGDAGSARFYAREAENAEKDRAVQAKIIRDLKTDTNIIDGRNLELTKTITAEVIKGADLAGSIGGVSDAPAKSKDIRTISDVLKDLSLDLKTAEQQFGSTFDDVTADKIGAYQKAIDDLVKLGVNPANEAFKRLKSEQAGLFDFGGQLGNVPKFDIASILGLGESGVPKVIKPVLKLEPVVLGVNELTGIVNTAESEIGRLTSLPSLLGVASNALNQGFVGMGEAIASGGNIIEAAGSAVQSAFADLLAALGKQFITMGTAKIAAGILAFPFGAAMISQGAGLVALGAGLSIGGGIVGGIGKGGNNSPQRQAPTAFANGGVIYGPTLGLMGEYAGAKNDPEVVAPLSKLRSILGDVNADNGFMQAGTSSNSNNSISNSNNYGSGSNGSTAQPIVFAPKFTQELKIRGKDLYSIIKQAQQDDSRT